ncbi:MAG: hypothetical protein MZV63_12090 [Marinilabiliales bacterium]|nr:hypothetical protein [Marinilabiliales bacterium]
MDSHAQAGASLSRPSTMSSAVVGMFIMQVVEVTTPFRCDSRMPREIVRRAPVVV